MRSVRNNFQYVLEKLRLVFWKFVYVDIVLCINEDKVENL